MKLLEINKENQDPIAMNFAKGYLETITEILTRNQWKLHQHKGGFRFHDKAPGELTTTTITGKFCNKYNLRVQQTIISRQGKDTTTYTLNFGTNYEKQLKIVAEPNDVLFEKIEGLQAKMEESIDPIPLNTPSSLYNPSTN